MFDHLRALLEAGIPEDGVSADDRRRMGDITSVSVLTAVIGIVFVFEFVRIGAVALSVGVAVTAAFCLANAALLRRTLRPQFHGVLGTTALFALLLAAIWNGGGFDNPNFSWLFVVPVVATLMADVTVGAVFTVAVSGAALAMWAAPSLGFEATNHLSVATDGAVSLVNRTAALIAIGAVLITIDGRDRISRVGLTKANNKLTKANEALRAEMAESARLHEQLVHSERLASMGTLAAGLAHEINNPLTYVTGNLQLLEEELAASGSEDALRRIRDMKLGAAQVERLLQDLKYFAQPEGPDSEPIDVKTSLESALNIAGSELKNTARLIRDFEDVPPVLGSAQRMVQVFLNLITNAIHAIDEGDARSNEIRVVLRNDDDVVRFEIHDTGPGVPLDVQTRMFEPYFTTKARDKGTGLGLPVCRSIVSAMGGELQLVATENPGAVFRVLLPATAARAGSAPATSAEASRWSGRRPKVLVVDDEPHVRRLVESALRGCRVICVESAHDALVANDNTDFDLQLYDIMMPTMSGIELFQEIERRYPDRVSAIYFMTGGVSTAAKHDELEHLTDRVLTKPLDIGALRDLVKERARLSRRKSIPGPTVH